MQTKLNYFFFYCRYGTLFTTVVKLFSTMFLSSVIYLQVVCIDLY